MTRYQVTVFNRPMLTRVRMAADPVHAAKLEGSRPKENPIVEQIGEQTKVTFKDGVSVLVETEENWKKRYPKGLPCFYVAMFADDRAIRKAKNQTAA